MWGIDLNKVSNINNGVMQIAQKYLNAAGCLVMKTYQGLLEEEISQILRIYFKDVNLVKTKPKIPPEMKKTKENMGFFQAAEKELYLIATGFMLSDSLELRKIRQIEEEESRIKTKEDQEKFNAKMDKEIEKIMAEINEIAGSIFHILKNLIKIVDPKKEIKEEDMKKAFEDMVEEEEKKLYGRSLKGITLEKIVQEYKEKLEDLEKGKINPEPESDHVFFNILLVRILISLYRKNL